ncbi:TetR/AcrR family transcriptional regulator [Nocardioides marmorisolisilvae]|uniref:TetR/AcrR family transcriptional regulator n=1 Tax=Nocardioides marmorisolisilvae TaxID=1542737 RepID=A0A3N0DQ40_9ACTN|nr:TetR/AcrR family transcriptional regulator [Nocardioides marmorisolisilvae]RNL77556.1 TetR/AcrR family transcriptional regulator [Nocardioides marmorisolisilvae]
MATEPVTSHLRLGLNPRQTETVEKLLLAGEEELEAVGPEALTIRMVAQRAGVSPATAYTYLASKNHLFAELFWRRIVTEPGPEPDGATAVDRIRTVTRHFAALLGRSPHLATAANMALLGTDPEVERLRLVIGAEFVDRFRTAIGEPADPRVVEALTLAFSGALLQAGMGLMTYEELSERLDSVVAVIMEGH